MINKTTKNRFIKLYFSESEEQEISENSNYKMEVQVIMAMSVVKVVLTSIPDTIKHIVI